jgi:hypothetical protein
MTFQRGVITSPSTSGSFTFSTAFTGAAPYVFLTADYGSGTTIVNVGLAGVTLTGFNYLVSSTGLAKLYWMATQ